MGRQEVANRLQSSGQQIATTGNQARAGLREPRPRTRLTTSAPISYDYGYSDYNTDYSDYDYRPVVTTPRARVRSRGRTVNRATTRPPVTRAPVTRRPLNRRPSVNRARYNDYEDNYSDYAEQRTPVRSRGSSRGSSRRTTASPFGSRGRNLDYNYRGQQAIVDPLRKKEETEKRNRLFLQNKDRYCNPKDFSDVDLLSSRDQEDPSFITVTHLLGNGIWGLGATSEELVPVAQLKSTDISASPLIYYAASTGADAIVFSGLVADVVQDVAIKPTCVLGRSSTITSLVTKTEYTVQPVTQSLLLPGLDQPDLTSLLISLLAKDMGSVSLPPQLPISASTSLVTSLSTLSSTYLTTLTETDTTLISLTFRGKEVVSTLTSTSTRAVTATEFSTSTIITPSIIITPPLVSQQSLQPVITTAAPLIPSLSPSEASTYLVTHTSTSLRTTMEEQTTVIPITLRGKAISTTLTDSKLVTRTETSVYTETRTHTPTPALPSADLALIAPVLNDLGLTYQDLDLDLVSLLLNPSTPALLNTPLPSLPLQPDLLDSQTTDLWEDFILSGKNF